MSTAGFFHSCPALSAGKPRCNCFDGLRPFRLLRTGDVPQDELRRRERELCNCGLAQVGYVASWALAHVDACPAAALFQGKEGYL